MITNKIKVVKNLYVKEEGKGGEDAQSLRPDERRQLEHEKLMILKARKTIRGKRVA